MESESDIGSDFQAHHTPYTEDKKRTFNSSSFKELSPLTGLAMRMEEEASQKEFLGLSSLKDYCEVCYSKTTAAFQDERLEKLFKLIHCKGCGTSAHLICYGLATPLQKGPSDGYNDDGKKYFVCDRCREGCSNKEIACYICNNSKDGCLRLASDKNKWVHTLCAVESSNVSIDDVTTMSIDLNNFRKETQKISTKKRCTVCSVKVETLPCTQSGGRYCHLHCALQDAFKEPEHTLWNTWFSLRDNKRARVGEVIDEKRLSEDAEDMALGLKEVIGKVGMKGELGIIMELKSRKSTKNGKTRQKVNKEDPRVSRFFDNVVAEAKYKNQQVFGEGMLDELADDDTIKHVGGKVVIVYDKKGDAILRMQEQDDEEEFEELLGNAPNEEDLKETIHSFYREIFNENGLLEVYLDEKLPIFREELPKFPNLKVLSFPEVVFFAVIFQKRAEAAERNLIRSSDLEDLIQSARMIPFTLGSQLRRLNQKHFCGLVADVVLEPYINRCAPASAYFKDEMTFNEDIIKRNNSSIKQIAEVKKLYLKEACGVITECFSIAVGFQKQLNFLKEFYLGIIKYFNNNDYSKKDPYANLNRNSFSRPYLPKVPLIMLTSHYAKAKAVGLNLGLAEMELLETLVKQGNQQQFSDQRPQQPQSTLDFFTSKRRMSEDSVNSFDDNWSRRSDSRGFEPKEKKAPKPVKEKKTTPNKSGGGRGRGRPRKSETVANEINSEFRIKIRRLNEKPTLQEAQRILEGGSNELFKQFNEDQLEESIVKAKEWRRQYEDAIESGEDRRLKRLVDQIDMIDVRVPEMSKLLEMKKEFDLWRNKVEDLHKRLKKKVDDVYTEKDKMVDMNEIREAVEAHKTIKMFEIDDGGKFRDLEKRVETIFKIKENMERGQVNSSFGQLKELEKQLKENNIYIEEIGELKEKQYINEKIERVLENPCTVEDIERVFKEVSGNMDTIDSTLLVQLRTKEQKAKKINDEAATFLKNHKTSFEIEEISFMVFMIKEADAKKIRSDKIQALKNNVQDFLLFGNIYSTLFSVEKIDLDKLETNEYSHFTGRDTEKLTRKCVETLRDTIATLSESKIRDLKEVCRDFRNSHRDNSSYMHPFFEQIASIIWRVNDKESSGFEKRRNESVTTKASFKAQTAKSTNSPFKGGDMIEVETYSAIDTEKFLSQYDDETPKKPSLARGDEAVMLNILEKAEKSTNIDFEELIEELERLKAKHEKSPSATKLSGLFVDSKKLVEKIKCAIDAVILKKGVDEEGRVIPYSQLERIAQRIEEVGLPSKIGLCRILSNWCSKAQNARKDYYRVYEKKKDKLNIPDIDKIRIEELIVKNRVKPSYEEAKEILATLKSVKQFTVLKDEIEVVEKDMEVFEDLALNVEGLIKKYSPLFEKYIIAKEKYTKHIYEVSSEESAREVEEIKEALKSKRDSIKKDLDKLKRDLAASPLRRKSEEMSIKIFSWLCETVIFISGVGRKAEKDIVEKMIKIGKELELEKDTRIEKVIRLLKLQLSNAQSIKEFVEKMRRNEASVTADEVREKKIELQDCQVLLLTEEDVLESYKTAPSASKGKESRSKEILVRDRTNLMKTEDHPPREYRVRGLEDSMDSNRFKENNKEDSLSSLLPGTQIPARILTPAKNTTPAPKEQDDENSRGSSLSAELLAGPKVPEGTILRIYEGCIEDVDEKEYQKLGLYTCDSFDTVNKIPQINSGEATRLRITKKVPNDKFEEYLTFTFANRLKKSEKVVAGWIESHISIYQSRCDQIAKELLANEVVAVCEYNQSSRVFLMHKNQMKDEWKTELNFREKKVYKGSNPSLFFILVHKPYKLKGDTKMIVPEIVTASSEKNTPNSHGVDKSHHMFSATTDNTDNVVTGKEMEEEDAENSSIEPSPEKEEEVEEFGQEQYTNTNKSVATESMPVESSGWGENAKKNENMERETRLMLGEDEWTLNAKLGENSINGKRGFEYYEQLRAAKKTPAPTKQQREEAQQEDDEEEEEDVEKVEKKVKREEADYQQLVERLHDLDQEEIMEIAKGLDNAGREAIIQLLLKAEKDADADEETHTENKRLISILTPTKDMKEFQSTDPIIVHRTPPKNEEAAAPVQKDPIIVQKPATPSSMLNVFNTPTRASAQKPVNFNVQRSPCADIFEMGTAIAAIRERNENSPNRSVGSHRSDGSPAFGGRHSPLASFGAVTAKKNDAGLGNLLSAQVNRIPSASKSDSANYKRSAEDKIGGGSRSVENKTGDGNDNQIPPQFLFVQEFLNLQSATAIQNVNECTLGFAQQQGNPMNEEIPEEGENVAIEEEAQGFLNANGAEGGIHPEQWNEILGNAIKQLTSQTRGGNFNQYH